MVTKKYIFGFNELGLQCKSKKLIENTKCLLE